MMIRNIFADVLKDNFSGSGQILFRVQQSVLQYIRTEKNFKPDVLLKQLEEVEQHFPQFALLFHFTNELKMFSKENTFAKRRLWEEFVILYQKQWEKAQQKASKNLLENLSLSGKSILLHSNSSAIHNLFQLLAKRKTFPTVWQTMSSPANEGLKQAEVLRKLGFQVHIFHEDATSKFIKNMDMALFGADLIWDDAFLNKVGTFPLALLFQYFHKPVYVLAESRKKINRSEIDEKRFQQFIDEKPKPAKEISENISPELLVHNYYFETIPLTLIERCFYEK